MNRLYINKDWITLKKLIAIKAAGGGAPMVEYIVTGNPATFETNVIAPMELLIPFAPVQSGSGTPSPENIRPISGWTEANVMISPTFSPDDPDKEVYHITFPSEAGTVYGGTLTVNKDGTGTLVVDRAKETYNDSTGFSLHASSRWYKNVLPNNLSQSKKTQSISNVAKYQDSPLTYGTDFAFGSSGIYVNRLNSDETIEEFNTRLQETPMVVCYPLDTPVTYNLTDLEVIETLKGANNVWSDTNDSNTIKYMKKG